MGPFNWAQVLRHEFTHTVTLSATENRSRLVLDINGYPVRDLEVSREGDALSVSLPPEALYVSDGDRAGVHAGGDQGDLLAVTGDRAGRDAEDPAVAGRRSPVGDPADDLG